MFQLSIRHHYISYCHAQSLHLECDWHSKTITDPQVNPWPDLLNSAENSFDDYNDQLVLLK